MSSASQDPLPARIRVEVCLDSVESATAAEAGGADQIELCAALEVGGVTPSVGMVRACRAAVSIPIMVMLRPRAGDFVYSDAEFSAMCVDLEIAKDSGANGVVLGLLTPTGELDRGRLEHLIQAARPMAVTFHRAFDMMPEPCAAIPVLAELGIDRVLTSGGCSRANQAHESLRKIVAVAGAIGPDGPRIIPAAGIDAQNVCPLVTATGVGEIHVGSACRIGRPSQMSFLNPEIAMGTNPGSDEYLHQVTSEALVREIVSALH